MLYKKWAKGFFDYNIIEDDIDKIEESEIRTLTDFTLELRPKKEDFPLVNAYLSALLNYCNKEESKNEILEIYKKVRKNRFTMMFFINDFKMALYEKKQQKVKVLNDKDIEEYKDTLKSQRELKKYSNLVRKTADDNNEFIRAINHKKAILKNFHYEK